ncbi:MAG: hypothetical protein IJ735_01750 [Clostridia bacterium]|nr:hypothetical protein [Clostridia bacterium]
MRRIFKKFRVHPLFFAYAALLVFLGQGRLLFCTVLAVACHETAHYFVAKRRGYLLTDLKITPLGAVLSAKETIADADLFAIAVAGPVTNILLSLSTVAMWWIFPESYGLTREFLYANLSIGCFNLLPLYPLDGSRIVTSFCKDKEKCLKVLRVSGYVSSAAFAVLFIVSIFFSVSYSCALVSVLLYLGAAFDAKNERYVLQLKRLFMLRDAGGPLEKKELYINARAKVGRLLRALKNDAVYTVNVIDDANRIVKILREEDLEKLFLRDRNEPII